MTIPALCPHCLGETWVKARRPRLAGPRSRYRILCLNAVCGAHGPWCDSPLGAVSAWKDVPAPDSWRDGAVAMRAHLADCAKNAGALTAEMIAKIPLALSRHIARTYAP